MENPPFLMVFTRKDGIFMGELLVSGRVGFQNPKMDLAKTQNLHPEVLQSRKAFAGGQVFHPSKVAQFERLNSRHPKFKVADLSPKQSATDGVSMDLNIGF